MSPITSLKRTNVSYGGKYAKINVHINWVVKIQPLYVHYTAKYSHYTAIIRQFILLTCK
jgi:hypothetical protein